MPLPERPRRADSSALSALPLVTVLCVSTVVLMLGLNSGGSPTEAAMSTHEVLPERGRTAASPGPAGEMAARTQKLIDLLPQPLVPERGQSRARAAKPIDLSTDEAPPDVEDTSSNSGSGVESSRGVDGLSALGRPNQHRIHGGRVERGAFHKGLRQGPWEVLRSDGSLERSGTYESGLAVGTWETWSALGQLTETMEYVGGERQGDWSAYADDGTPIGSGGYEADLRHGLWTLYYTDGRVKETGTFLHGLREGPWEFYDDLGNVTVRTGVYSAGVKLE